MTAGNLLGLLEVIHGKACQETLVQSIGHMCVSRKAVDGLEQSIRPFIFRVSACRRLYDGKQPPG